MTWNLPRLDWTQPISPVRPSETPVQTPEPPADAPAFFVDDQRESSKKEEDANGENENWKADFDTKNGEKYRGCNCGNRASAMDIHKSWMEQKPGNLLILTFGDGEKREIPYTNIVWMRVYKNEEVF